MLSFSKKAGKLIERAHYKWNDPGELVFDLMVGLSAPSVDMGM